MSKPNVVRTTSTITLLAAVLYLSFAPRMTFEVQAEEHSSPAAAATAETVDNSRPCDATANVQERCVY
jgi:hypothetical protein